MKTVSGMAMAVAASVDAMKMPEIVGSIAGDDTIMMAIRTVFNLIAIPEQFTALVRVGNLKFPTAINAYPRL